MANEVHISASCGSYCPPKDGQTETKHVTHRFAPERRFSMLSGLTSTSVDKEACFAKASTSRRSSNSSVNIDTDLAALVNDIKGEVKVFQELAGAQPYVEVAQTSSIESSGQEGSKDCSLDSLLARLDSALQPKPPPVNRSSFSYNGCISFSAAVAASKAHRKSVSLLERDSVIAETLAHNDQQQDDKVVESASAELPRTCDIARDESSLDFHCKWSKPKDLYAGTSFHSEEAGNLDSARHPAGSDPLGIIHVKECELEDASTVQIAISKQVLDVVEDDVFCDVSKDRCSEQSTTQEKNLPMFTSEQAEVLDVGRNVAIGYTNCGPLDLQDESTIQTPSAEQADLSSEKRTPKGSCQNQPPMPILEIPNEESSDIVETQSCKGDAMSTSGMSEISCVLDTITIDCCTEQMPNCLEAESSPGDTNIDSDAMSEIRSVLESTDANSLGDTKEVDTDRSIVKTTSTNATSGIPSALDTPDTEMLGEAATMLISVEAAKSDQSDQSSALDAINAETPKEPAIPFVSHEAPKLQDPDQIDGVLLQTSCEHLSLQPKLVFEDSCVAEHVSETSGECAEKQCVHQRDSSAKEASRRIVNPENLQKDKTMPAIRLNVVNCKWDIVIMVAQDRGWEIVDNEYEAKSCNFHWIDNGTLKTGLPLVQPWQRVNHFPGMCKTLGRKCRLARNMGRMRYICRKEYNFVPYTWAFPEELPDLVARFHKDPDATYIVKPDGGSMGRGIWLTNDLDKLKQCATECRLKGESMAVQKYVPNPMLIEGKKFDLRIYCLVCGMPSVAGKGLNLRLFLFRDGLVRICTESYKPPSPNTFEDICVHLTNYEVNRFSPVFVPSSCGEDNAFSVGDKRSVTWFLKYLTEQYGKVERDRIWAEIKGICAKTVLSAQPTLEAEYEACLPKDLTAGHMGCRCFEILGFDIILNSQRKAFLLEVNHLPSFALHTPLDVDVKRRLVGQTLDLIYSAMPVTSADAYKTLHKKALAPAKPPTDSLLDCSEFKDFERIFPPTEEMPADVAKDCETVLRRVREVFASVASKSKTWAIDRRKSIQLAPWVTSQAQTQARARFETAPDCTSLEHLVSGASDAVV